MVLSNGESGWLLERDFQRRLLEVLYGAAPLAERDVRAMVRAHELEVQAFGVRFQRPARPADVRDLAPRYHSAVLGGLSVQHREGGVTVFDFGEWAGEVASHRNQDGSVSFKTVGADLPGFELNTEGAAPHRRLTLEDGSERFVFEEIP